MLHSIYRKCTATAALATAITCSPVALSVVKAQSSHTARQTDTVRAILAAESAVVNIEGNKPSGKVGAGEPQQVNGMGSGVIIDSRGYILTNQHVVQDVSRLEVTLHDGTKYIGEPIAHDPSTDLALIKINSHKEFPVIRFGTSSDLMRGEKVVAIGNPFGYQHTVTEGIISALHRDIPVNGVQEYQDLIQTDASINPGNSGGPLVNIDGNMIGLNAAVRVGAQGIGFAIPVDKALDVAAGLIAKHRRSGLESPLEVRSRFENGKSCLKVTRVPNGATRGIDEGDTIVRIGDRMIRNRLDYEMALLDHPQGSEVEIEYDHSGEKHVVQLAMAARSGASNVSLVSARNTDSASYAWNVLGIKLKEADPQLVRQVDPSYSGGLVIESVRDRSPAQLAKLQQGDILVGLLEWQATNWKELDWIFFSSSEMKKTSKPKFRIIRGQGVYYGTLDLAKQSVR